MKVGILGTGMVGQTIATALRTSGHDVMMGARSADNPNARAWAEAHDGAHGSFDDAAAFGALLCLATAGTGAIAALERVAPEHLAGKVVMDVTNPLDLSRGMPPTLFVSNDDSLGEQLQRGFPDARFVKTLNTMNADLMVNPSALAEPHEVFVSGDDAEAKAQVSALLREAFGWQQVTDLGDITTARATEAYLHLWLRLWKTLGTTRFNIRLVREAEGAPEGAP